MLGAWPELTKAEGEEQESETEEYEAIEKQQKVVQTIGRPSTKAESLLGNGRILTENSKAVWAWQNRAKKAAKAASGKISFSLYLRRYFPVPYHHLSRIFLGCGKALHSGKLQLLVAELELTVLAGLESVSSAT